ncbi:ATP-binding protein [Streptomyces chartreusis]
MTASPLGRVGAGYRGDSQFNAFFLADQAAIPPVRRRLRARLEAEGLGRVADDVTLACQELMANAVIHGCRHLPTGTRLTVTATWNAMQLRVAVHDPSDENPRQQADSSSRTDGRGLRLVSALSDRWGVQPDPVRGGKSVWMELDMDAADRVVEP